MISDMCKTLRRGRFRGAHVTVDAPARPFGEPVGPSPAALGQQSQPSFTSTSRHDAECCAARVVNDAVGLAVQLGDLHADRGGRMHVSFQDGEFLRRQLGRLLNTATHRILISSSPTARPAVLSPTLYCAAGAKAVLQSATEMPITSVISGVHLL